MGGLQPSFIGYHWHGDIFDLPKGTTALTSSARTAYQAFSYGRAAYRVLFHMEVTTQIIADMVRAFADEVREEGLDGEQIKPTRPSTCPPSTPTDEPSSRTWATL